MLKARLILVLLFVACFSLATCLQPRQASRAATEEASGNVLVALLGDGRNMFANEFFAKADAYFHRGNYPSIFDMETHKEENHMTGEAAHGEPAQEAEGQDKHDDGPAPAGDWIERFGRHFYPTEHVHLHEGAEREMLPWLRLSTELDPHKVETYAVTAYWLRDRLGKVDEAEQCLREGLRANPNAPELLNELGRLLFENRKDFARSRNVWQVALRRWREVEGTKKEPDKLLLAQILGGLTRVEIQEGRSGEAIEYLKQLKEISPSPEEIQKRIDELQLKLQGGGAN